MIAQKLRYGIGLHEVDILCNLLKGMPSLVPEARQKTDLGKALHFVL